MRKIEILVEAVRALAAVGLLDRWVRERVVIFFPTLWTVGPARR